MKVGIVSLGCPKNLVDTELMLGILEKKYEITATEKNADIIIINTCGFIDSAKQESINTILEMTQYKKRGCRAILVTGCLAERYREEIINEIPEVDAVLGTGYFSEIDKIITRIFEGKKHLVLAGNLDKVDYLENKRKITTGKGYAYIKISEGCNNCCTYCIIPQLRGSYRSRKIENIIYEAKKLVRQGFRELIIIAQDTTYYGIDIYGESKLVELLQRLSSLDGLKWIRLLYCYPELISSKLINQIAENKKICNYLDLPVQHGSDKILKKMGRRGKSKRIEKLINYIRKKIPDIVIRTSIITGFPGEQNEDYDILCDFVKKIKFDRLGVFVYSREEDTPAAEFADQVNDNVKQERYADLMNIQHRITVKKNEQRINRIYTAIVEGIADDGIFYFGRTYAEAPDIDGKVYFTSRKPLTNGDMVDVKILNIDEYDLIGEVVYESSK